MANIVEIIIRAKDDFSKGMNAPIKSMGDLSDAAKKIGPVMATAAVAVTVAFGAMMRSAIDLGDELDEMAQKYGVSAASLGAMKLGAEQSGVSLEGLGKGLKFLSKSMAGASEDGEGTDKIFKAIGVSAKDSTGKLRPTEAVFIDIATALSKYEDGAAKTALMMKLLGKSGADLIPYMNQGGDAIRKMMENSKELGVVMSDDQAAAAGILNDKLAEMKAAFMGIATQVAVAVVPTLTSATTATLEWARESKALTLVINVLRGALIVLFNTGNLIVQLFKGIGMTLGGVIAAVVQVFKRDFSGALDTLKSIGSEWVKLDQQTIDFANGLEGIKKSADGAGASLKKMRGPVFGGTEKKGKGFEDFSLVGKLSKYFADSEKIATEAAMVGYLKIDAIRKNTAEAIKKYNEDEAAAAASLSGIERFMWEGKAKQNVDDLAAAAARLQMVREIALLSRDQKSMDFRNAGQDIVAAVGSGGGVGNALNIAAIGAGEDPYTADFAAWSKIQDEKIAMMTKLGATESTIKAAYREKELRQEKMMTQQKIALARDSFGAAAGFMESLFVATGSRNKSMFNIIKALRMGEAVVNTAAAVTRALTEYSWPYSLVVAGLVGAAGAAQIATIGAQKMPAAHGGLDYVPAETTYLLQRGERVVSPKQNEDLTSFLQGGGAASNRPIDVYIGTQKLFRIIHDGMRSGELHVMPA